MLRIRPGACFEEVHKAYRLLAMQFHPDRNSTPDAASTMIAINEAYAVLSEPSSRRQTRLDCRAQHRIHAPAQKRLPCRMGKRGCSFRQRIAEEDRAAVIDLMRSCHHGAPFPDDVYRQLLAPFL